MIAVLQSPSYNCNLISLWILVQRFSFSFQWSLIYLPKQHQWILYVVQTIFRSPKTVTLFSFCCLTLHACSLLNKEWSCRNTVQLNTITCCSVAKLLGFWKSYPGNWTMCFTHESTRWCPVYCHLASLSSCLVSTCPAKQEVHFNRSKCRLVDRSRNCSGC